MIRAVFLGTLFLLSGCTKYAYYASSDKDFTVQVPFAWAVVTDAEGDAFRQVNFIGPYNPDFFRGAPSFSIRWHAYSKKHTLPNGGVEVYSSAEDYIKQMLGVVYGPDPVLHNQPMKGSKETKPCLSNLGDACPAEGKLRIGSHPFKNFIVVSPALLRSQHIGMSEEDGKPINPRKHEYVVIPLQTGFYVLVYPATTVGYPKYKSEFNQLVNTFNILKDGPAGPAVVHGTVLPVKKS